MLSCHSSLSPRSFLHCLLCSRSQVRIFCGPVSRTFSSWRMTLRNNDRVFDLEVLSCWCHLYYFWLFILCCSFNISVLISEMQVWNIVQVWFLLQGQKIIHLCFYQNLPCQPVLALALVPMSFHRDFFFNVTMRAFFFPVVIMNKKVHSSSAIADLHLS